jgi:hypothetical protein
MNYAPLVPFWHHQPKCPLKQMENVISTTKDQLKSNFFPTWQIFILHGIMTFKKKTKILFSPNHSIPLKFAKQIFPLSVPRSPSRNHPSLLRRVLQPPASISPSLSLPRSPSLSSGAHPLSSGDFFGHRRLSVPRWL